MARNEEKAMAMLNRWVTMKRMINAKPRDKRPETPLEINKISECEIWRYFLFPSFQFLLFFPEFSMSYLFFK
jgi:hypothetical protein